MVIVDTSVWIDYFRGAGTAESQWLDTQAEGQRLGLVDLIFCEVLEGIRENRDYLTARDALLKFEIFAAGGLDAAIETAQSFRRLSRKGITIRRRTDCWIATFCIREGHALLHSDRDFDPFEKELGLRVVRP
jgi:predicted nucleic acid-binding protein